MIAKNVLIKTSAVLMSLVIIGILVISGPAQAFTLAVDSNKDFVNSGENVTFNVSVKMNSNEEASINTITLTFDGPDKQKCVFDVNGNKLSSCPGIVNITKISVSNGGYGYLPGFGYGFRDKEVTYKITLDTDEYSLGAYSIIAKAVIGSNVIIQEMSNKVVIRSSSASSSSNPYGHSRGNSKKTTESSSSSKGVLKVTNGDKFIIMTSEEWHNMQIENIDSDSVNIVIESENQRTALSAAIVRSDAGKSIVPPARRS